MKESKGWTVILKDKDGRIMCSYKGHLYWVYLKKMRAEKI